MATSVQPETTTEDERVSEPRLRMKPDGAERGQVDGGWWPRSTDLEAELPSLAAALEQWVGPVTRVSYHLDTWGPATRKVYLGDRIVPLEGFRFTNPHTITAIGSNARQVILLVVPPETPREAAHAALRAAAGDEFPTATSEILAGKGVPA
ncbi:DUF5994 family protein [Amycolatopsis sp. NPDC023774]|uniref:DUF5994 family protein n=1 Tax=Amycolatopsis sp. NPDC023774 TaxID=3155015 RepID=UPI0033D0F6DA